MSNDLVSDTNIRFSDLKTAYISGGNADASGHSSLNDNKNGTKISLSFFRNARLLDGTSIPGGNNPLSINNNFKGKIFGRKITTDKFRAHTTWSTNSSYLIGKNTPSAGQGNTGTSDITNKTIQLINPHNNIYSTILISPNSSSSDTPGFSVNRTNNSSINEATLWINLRSRNTGVSYGIIPLDTSMTGNTTKDKWNNQKSYIYNKHGNYHDRLAYNGGHFNYPGSRDDITSTTSIIQPNYRTGTYGNSLTENFHNITGVTAGTMGSANPGTLSNSYWFYTNTYSNFTTYNTQGVNLGFKVKWYETTLQVSLVQDSNIIQPVSPPSNWSSSDLSGIFSGMYVTGTGINSNDGAFIGDINTNYMRLYKGKGVSQITPSLATSDQTNVTLTISGYLYWVLGTTSDYTESPKIIGPPHKILPKYQATGSNLSTISEVEEWSFFVGDSTNSSSNYFEFDIRNTEPSGSAFSYSVSYTSGTVPTSGPSTGVYPSTNLYTGGHLISSGNKGTSLQTVTYDLSSSSYANASVIGKSGHLLYNYSTASGSNKYRADIQILSVNVNGVTYTIGGSAKSGLASYGSWRRSTGNNNQTYTSGGYSSLSSISNFGTNTTHTTTAYSHRWVRKTSGNTSSGSTGVNTSSSHIMFEATNGGSSYPLKGILVSPQVTFTSNSVTIKFYAYGADIGNLRGGVEII